MPCSCEDAGPVDPEHVHDVIGQPVEHVADVVVAEQRLGVVSERVLESGLIDQGGALGCRAQFLADWSHDTGRSVAVALWDAELGEAGSQGLTGAASPDVVAPPQRNVWQRVRRRLLRRAD